MTVTPIPNKCLIILLDCSAILFANSLIVITSGIFISLLIGFKLSLASSFFNSLFSFCLALFNEAKLLPLEKLSSSLKALDIVNLSSLLLGLNLLFESFVIVSPFNLFVALCSANLRFSKSDELDKFGFFKKGGFCDVKVGFSEDLLLKFLEKFFC